MVQLYKDNAIEVMQQLINNRRKIDCIITDPPYPVTSRGNSGNSGGMLQKDINKKGKVFENNDTHVKVWGEKCYQVLKDSGHCYIMTNHVNLIEYLNVLTDIGFHFIKSLIWDKGNKIMGQYYMSQFEYILFFRKGTAKKINFCNTPDILTAYNSKTKYRNGENIHDTEKPTSLMRILIENSTQENEVVLDPFMGSGSTGVAAKELGRIFIGIEIDPKYQVIAEQRIKTTNKLLL